MLCAYCHDPVDVKPSDWVTSGRWFTAPPVRHQVTGEMMHSYCLDRKAKGIRLVAETRADLEVELLHKEWQ